MAQEISIRQSLSRAYKNIKVQRSELSLFFDTLRTFLHEHDVDSQDQAYNKKLIDMFLTKAFYSNSNAINTNNPTDLVIFADATAKGSHPVVLFEVKMPGNDERLRRDDLYHQYVETQDKRFLETVYQVIYDSIGLTPDKVDLIYNQADT